MGGLFCPAFSPVSIVLTLAHQTGVVQLHRLGKPGPRDLSYGLKQNISVATAFGLAKALTV